MIVDVEIGVQQPDAVDIAAVKSVLPYGQSVKVSHGGLDVPKPDGTGATIIANAAVVVSFDIESAERSKRWHETVDSRWVWAMTCAEVIIRKAACRAIHDALSSQLDNAVPITWL